VKEQMKHALAVLVLLAALAAGVYALMLQLITLATNDPTDYQPLLKSGLLWAGVSLALTTFFVFLVRRYWRLATLAPVAASGAALWGIARMWPYAFT
jgi:hypothetical protein